MKSKYAVAAGGDNDAEPLRYVLYARKSSEDVGAQAKSLPDQIKDCLSYAEPKGIVIVETLKESHSAKTFGRCLVFTKILKDLEPGKSGGIPKWGYNRSEITGLYEPDENFDHIRHAFDMYLDGYTQNEIIAYLRKNDVHRMAKITRKNKKVRKIAAYNSAMVISNILSDPFYYGMLVQAGQSVDLRKLQTNFKPMLTEEEFGLVQARRRSLRKTITASAVVVKNALVIRRIFVAM